MDSPHFSAAAVDDEIMEQMRDLHLRMHRLFNELLKRAGASVAQLKLLDLIDKWGVVRSADIAEALGQAPRTVTDALDGLERDGLITRIVDAKDRRAKRISLTEAGHKVRRDAAPVREAYMVQLLDVLSADEKASYLNMLHMLNERLVEMGAPPVLGAGAEGTAIGES
ncbi:hypothetical protein ASE00_01865 [Sphingomonas sp. Root710]|uniref:MarR family winged helix-turn-helix transcriptional regulator n=1 Tax=Sphingomonas sp. Root710 TaxID=1736594 RepID=UPI0006FDD6D8|nr:MarR family transcriptional regulator [Sphingomonas sp. Root710]KRB85567.1 hypothetical protein ASE00_01865 [Sphingomonas sp. Root710]